MTKKITLESTVKDLKETPTGHDLLKSFIDENDETILANIKDRDFVNTLIIMANYGNESEDNNIKSITKKWWKEAIFYQIYTRSFKDSNNDGIGDIKGIIEKLDYISDLGANAIWISPFLVSPQVDNGYDVADYYTVDSLFGNMQDIEELINKAHQKNIKVIMDMVLNHTSDKHHWFQDVINNTNSKYDDYYFIKDKPNNWTSLFSGTAWSYLERRNKYALHLFSKHQYDLNWHNKKVQDEGINILNFWLNKGIDGFRFDVASFLSKDNTLPDGNEKLGKIIGFTGVEHYFHGPELDKLFQRFRKESYGNYDSYTVGECGGNGTKLTYLLTAEERQEMDSTFNFDHCENPGKHRFDIYNYSLMHLIESLIQYRKELNEHCWNTLFIENHDSPRIPSKVRPDNLYHNEISKLVNTVLLTLKGTPYLYQGEEIGMLNTTFNNIDEINDVESINKYNELLKQGLDKDEAFKHILYGSRDHARTPMQWDKDNSFSKTKPWLRYSNHPEINVLNQENDEKSVLNYTKKMIKLRKENICFVYGKQDLLYKDNNVIIYERKDETSDFIIEVNTSDNQLQHPINIDSEILISNYDDKNILKPYQIIIYKKQ